MIELLALLALLAGPLLFLAVARRVLARARATGVAGPAVRHLVRDGEARAACAGMLLPIAALLTLAVEAVLS